MTSAACEPAVGNIEVIGFRSGDAPLRRRPFPGFLSHSFDLLVRFRRGLAKAHSV